MIFPDDAKHPKTYAQTPTPQNASECLQRIQTHPRWFFWSLTQSELARDPRLPLAPLNVAKVHERKTKGGGCRVQLVDVATVVASTPLGGTKELRDAITRRECVDVIFLLATACTQ